MEISPWIAQPSKHDLKLELARVEMRIKDLKDIRKAIKKRLKSK